MDERWNDIYDLAEAQHGHFTTKQAEMLGFARSTLHHHLQEGRIRRVAWGIYRLRNYPPSEFEQEAVLMLWSADRDGEPQAVISHETALAHFDLSDVLPAKIHLTVPASFRKQPPSHVELHKAELPEGDVRQEGLLRYTTPIRTLLDLLDASFSAELLVRSLAEGLERGWIRGSDLARLEAVSADPDDDRSSRAERLLQEVQIHTP